MAVDSGPATNGAAVTPSDTATIGGCRSLWVGAAGNVTVDFKDGNTTIALVGVPSGTLLPISVLRVRATGTTATSIVALY